MRNKTSFNLPKIYPDKLKEELISKLEFYYDCNLNSLREFNFYYNENSQKIHISKINLKKTIVPLTRFSGIGIYFGTMHSNNRFRLSLEGSKFILNPKKNYILIDESKLASYLAAENLFQDEIIKITWENKCPFLIVICNNQNLGSISIKDNYIINYIPKSRKLDYNKLF